MIDRKMILDRLDSLYRRSQRLLAERRADAPAGVVVHASPYQFRQMPSRLEGVTDSLSGTRYAAWVIGETLAAVGGYDLMHSVFTAFERDHGPLAGSWLNQRWSNIGDGIWVA